jgi:hypothetical protein
MAKEHDIPGRVPVAIETVVLAVLNSACDPAAPAALVPDDLTFGAARQAWTFCGAGPCRGLTGPHPAAIVI